MKNKNVKGGRPPRVAYEDKKRLFDDYFLYEVSGDVSVLNKKGFYTHLAQYAKNHEHDYKTTDFSRCKQFISYLEEIKLRYTDSEQPAAMSVPGYTPLDIDYFLRPSILKEERTRLLLEWDAQNKSLHITAAKALEVTDSQRKENEELRRRLQSEVQKSRNIDQDMQGLIHDVRLLATENRYLKRYIHEYVEPVVAEAVLKGSFPDNLNNKAASLIPLKNVEPSVISLDKWLSSDIQEEAAGDDIDCLLSEIRRRHCNYED